MVEELDIKPVLYDKTRIRIEEPPPPTYVLEEIPQENELNGHHPDFTDEDPAAWKSLLIWQNEKKNLVDSTSSHNVEIFLGHSPKYKGIFKQDLFRDKVLVYRCPAWEEHPERFAPRPLEHLDVVRCRNALEIDGLRTGKDTVHDGIKLAALKDPIHPPRDYFNRIVWDGVSRLNRWLAYYLGAEGQPSEYLAAVGSFWMIAGVARIMNPGTKFDHMLVLEGEQGIYKSTALATLATFYGEEYFTDRITFSKLNDKDTMMMLQGKLIIEFSELANLNNKDFDEVKQWITLRTDEARKPYEREPITYRRQFILAGTTNDARWLRDPTGNRRFWPVRCGDKIDIEALERDREQLWAEAAHMYKNKIKFWMDKNDPIWKMAQREQAIRLIDDIWTSAVINWVESYSFVRTEEILKECLLIEPAKQGRLDQMRISNILKTAGWHEISKYDPLKKRQRRGWEKKKEQQELL